MSKSPPCVGNGSWSWEARAPCTPCRQLSRLEMFFPGSSAGLRVSWQSLMLMYAWGGRNLVNFRDLLKPLSHLLPEFKIPPPGWDVSPPLRTPVIFMSFPPRWEILDPRKLLWNSCSVDEFVFGMRPTARPYSLPTDTQAECIPYKCWVVTMELTQGEQYRCLLI